MNQKKRPSQIIVTLKKVPYGYQIIPDQEKVDTTTTVRIPKFVVQDSPQSKINKQQFQQQQQQFILPPSQTQQQIPLNIQPHHTGISPQQQYLYPGLNQIMPNFQLQNKPQIPFQPPPIYQKPQPQPPPQYIPPQHFEILPPDPINSSKQNLKLKIPTCSSWFSIETIHKIEQEIFKEYFDESKSTKTAALYKKHRNFIINLYHRTPETYLTLTTCRKLIPADVNSIVRIHGFLNHWGIINNQVDQEFISSKLIPQPVFPNDIFSKLLKETKNSEKSVVNEKKIIDSIKNLSEKLRYNQQYIRPICDSCSMKCSIVWYQQKPIKDVKEIILCIKCFGNNNFPNIFSAEDFYKTDIEVQLKNVDIQDCEIIDARVEDINEKDLCSILQILENNPDSTWDEILIQLNVGREKEITGIEVLMNFLAYPFLNNNNTSIERALETKESLSKLSVQDLAARIASEEVNTKIFQPQFFSDTSNVFTTHISIFKKNLSQIFQKEQRNGTNGEHSQQKTSLKTSELQICLNDLDHSKIEQLKEDSIAKSMVLLQIEENKLNESINNLISIQMEKVQQKLAFLEEYEKLILFEKCLLDLSQKQILAERLVVVQQKLEVYNEENNQ